ncbi:hypothetical protein [Streptomyces sp. 2A115]|uniref:hypothetical protein n=1 Tax=Streptomyces sp. 2A115 TaxID=3457439 RepID=UPI003FD4BCD6
MPLSSLPRSARARTGAAALTALTIAGTALLGAPAAFAAPGDNGDVKIHDAVKTPSSTNPRNDPKVCEFYLAAFNFDRAQTISWDIKPQPATSGSATLNGTLLLPTGAGRTPAETDVPNTLKLPDGQYKLTWKIVGGLGAGKHKVFKVDCKTPPASPNGAVPAGGGGLAEPSVSAVGAAAAVGLVGVSGFAYFRMLRRRPDGAA